MIEYHRQDPTERDVAVAGRRCRSAAAHMEVGTLSASILTCQKGTSQSTENQKATVNLDRCIIPAPFGKIVGI